MQLRKEYAVLLWVGGWVGGWERRRLFIFSPGVVRDWDQRKEAVARGKEEEEEVKREKVVEVGGKEEAVLGWGVKAREEEEEEEEGGGWQGGGEEALVRLCEGRFSHPLVLR